jgi:hypothetical protein
MAPSYAYIGICQRPVAHLARADGRNSATYGGFVNLGLAPALLVAMLAPWTHRHRPNVPDVHGQ